MHHANENGIEQEKIVLRRNKLLQIEEEFLYHPRQSRQMRTRSKPGLRISHYQSSLIFDLIDISPI